MADTIFTKIINRQIAADIVYEDDLCLAFRDVNPQAPVHILLIPQKPIEMLSTASAEDQALLGNRVSRIVPNGFDLDLSQSYVPSCGKRAILFMGAMTAMRWPPIG